MARTKTESVANAGHWTDKNTQICSNKPTNTMNQEKHPLEEVISQ